MTRIQPPECQVDELDKLPTRKTSNNQIEATSDGQDSASSTVALSSTSCSPQPLDGRQLLLPEVLYPDMSERDAELMTGLQNNKVIFKYVMENEFHQALELNSHRTDRLYAEVAVSTLCFFRALLTMEEADIRESVRTLQVALEVSASKKHKTSAASTVRNLLFRPDYNAYTDEEVHAEICHAEALQMLALITFLADQSIICLIRGAFRIRSCYQSYKECQYILENRSNWSSEVARVHFESGVRMGLGIFSLLMSYLPPRVLRLLEYAGFSGDRAQACEWLERSVAIDDGLRTIFSSLFILLHQSYIELTFGLGNYDIEQVERLNRRFSADHPNSAFFLLFLGRYYQMKGDQEEAVRTFERCISVQEDWKQVHYMCYWEMMWCHAIQTNWDQAVECAELMRTKSKWSACVYTYQKAFFLYCKLVQEEREGSCGRHSDEYRTRMGAIRELMEQVPELRVRYAGKTVPAEKFALSRSTKFCKQNNRLSLPDLEFLYIGNTFVTLRNSPKHVESILERVNAEVEYINQQLDVAEIDGADHGFEATAINWNDDLNLALLLKGLCLKYLARWHESEGCFLEVIQNESKIEEDTFVVAHSAMELALLYLERKNYAEAKRWVKKARNDYTGYLLESIVHFRLHAAERLIKLEQKNLEADEVE